MINTQINKYTNKQICGFTLLELIIVVGTIILILPVLFTIIFAILQEETKILRLSEVKRQGDNVLNLIENTIRNNAVGIYSNSALTQSICSTTSSQYPAAGTSDGTDFYFKDRLGHSFRFYLISTTQSFVASDSARGAAPSENDTIYLTTKAVTISGSSGSFGVSCNRTSTYSTPIVSISFPVSYNTTAGPDASSTLFYQTKIKLRNF